MSKKEWLKPGPPTGWPPPPLLQDDNRKLFAWFSRRRDARRLAREAAHLIETKESP